MNEKKILADSIKHIILSESIYKETFDLIQNDEKIILYFLHDLIKLKYKNTIGDQKKLENFVQDIIEHIHKLDNEKLKYETIVYQVFKSFKFIEILIQYYQNVSELVNLDTAVTELKTKDFKTIDDLILIEDKILRTFIDFNSTELIKSFQSNQLQTKTLEINQIFDLFNNCFIEIFSIKSNFYLIVESFYTFYFFTELLKILKSNDRSGKEIFLKISQMVCDKLDNTEFLRDVETLQSIIDLLQSSWEQDQEIISRFINFTYCLNVEITNETKIIEKVFDHFGKNPNLIKSSSILIGKLFESVYISIDLGFLKNDNAEFLSVMDAKLNDFGLDSNFAIICIEIISNQISDYEKIVKLYEMDLNENQNNESTDSDQEAIDDNEEIIEYLDIQSSLMNLFNLLKNFENGFISEEILLIKHKNIAHLTSIAYIRFFIEKYCAAILQNQDKESESELVILVNKILNDKEFKITNSLRLMALRVLEKSIGSYYALERFVRQNPNIKWRDLVEFGQPEVLIDIYLKSDKLAEQIETFRTFLNQQRFTNDIDFATRRSIESEHLEPSSKLSLCLAYFNYFYLNNTNQEQAKETSYSNSKFIDLFNALQDENLKKCLVKMANNFEGDEWLKASPDMSIESLKLISAIFHCASVVISHSNILNSLSSLFFDKKGNTLKDFNSKKDIYWLCTSDDEEFENLNSIKDLTFVSYSDDDINRDVPFGNGFGLYKCSDECKYYYTVGACTRVTENYSLKCNKGHLLMGKAYNQLHERSGHMKIPDANTFIPKRMQFVKQLAPKGYMKHSLDNLRKDHTVRSIKPVTFRVLHFIVHSTLYMMRVMEIYSKSEIIKLIGLENDDEFQDIDHYLR